MGIEAILFDLDDTLMPEAASDETALKKTFVQAAKQFNLSEEKLHKSLQRHINELWIHGPNFNFCSQIGIGPIEGLWGRFIGDDAGMTELRAWIPNYRQTFWSRVLADQGKNDPEILNFLSTTFQYERHQIHILFPDVQPNLLRLQKRYRLALITNGATDIQLEKIQSANLGDYFDYIVISGRVGKGKPDPEVFNIALKHLTIDAASAVMVGDNLDRDIFGAKRLGIKGIWMNRFDHVYDGLMMPDAEIRDLNQLTDHL